MGSRTTTGKVAKEGTDMPAGSADQLRVEYLPLSLLKPAKRNPKKHQLQTVLESMGRFGYVAPMILDERTGRLVAGHGRLDSLRKAKGEGKEPPGRIRKSKGDWLVPVVRGVRFDSEREAEAYLLADNQTTMLGGWDDEGLKQILEELAADSTLVGTGFEDLFEEWQEVEQDDPTPLIDNAGAPKEVENRTGSVVADWQASAVLRRQHPCGGCAAVNEWPEGMSVCHRSAVSGRLQWHQPSS